VSVHAADFARRPGGAIALYASRGYRERLRRGELGIDFYRLREKLKQLGVEYVDED